MSQENVEVVKRALAEFQRGNFWVPEFFAPDAVPKAAALVSSPDNP